jgi:hypothetical protein
MDTHYGDLVAALQRCGAVQGAAEAHGILCGLCCRPEGLMLEAFFNQVDALPGGEVESFWQLAEATLASLQSPDFTFTPLLPEDDEPLPERIQALSEWCQGLLYGLGNTGLDLAALSGDSREFLRDLTAISRAGPTMEAAPEEEETDLQEVIEFLRVGTVRIWEEAMESAPGAPEEED